MCISSVKPVPWLALNLQWSMVWSRNGFQMERQLIHRAIVHWQARQYRVHNRRWIAFDYEREIAFAYQLYWQDAHDNCMRLIAQSNSILKFCRKIKQSWLNGSQELPAELTLQFDFAARFIFTAGSLACQSFCNKGGIEGWESKCSRF